MNGENLTKVIKVRKQVWFCGCEVAGNPHYPWEDTPGCSYNSSIHEIKEIEEGKKYICHKNKVYLIEKYKNYDGLNED